MQVEITLDALADKGEISAVAEVVESLGLQCKSQETLHTRAEVSIPTWLIVLGGSVSLLLAPFLQGFGSEAGKQAWQNMRDVVAKFSATRKQQAGCLELMDYDTRTHLILSHDLPDEAFKQLVGLIENDPNQLRGGYWTWDDAEQRWNSL